MTFVCLLDPPPDSALMLQQVVAAVNGLGPFGVYGLVMLLVAAVAVVLVQCASCARSKDGYQRAEGTWCDVHCPTQLKCCDCCSCCCTHRQGVFVPDDLLGKRGMGVRCLQLIACGVRVLGIWR